MVPPPPYYPQLRTATEGGPDRSDGSRTITITPGRDSDDEGQHDDDRGEGPSTFQGVLRLRGGPGPRGEGPRVQWQDGTVDNEFLNRKKSKICCIFHKNKPKNFEDPFAESSSSSDSDSGDESSDASDEEPQDGQGASEESKENGTTNNSHAQDINTAKTKRKRRHVHGENCSHGSGQVPPNAYEIQPKYGKFKKDKQRNKGSSTMTVEGDA